MYYFVYKNGAGNSWSALSEKGHLYVGYDDDWRPDGSDMDRPSIKILDASSAKLRDDLGNILAVAHAANRDIFTLLTFENSTLRFWRVTGEVVRHEKGTPIWNEARNLAQASRVMGQYGYFHDDNVKLKNSRPTYPDLADKKGAFRTLPVKLVGEVPRQSLYTSIDSLSVYQYLNRGTCRPLWRISGPSGVSMPSAITLDHPSTVFAYGSRRQEEPFGAFARLYLNDVLATVVGDGFKVPAGLQMITGLDYEELVLATLNPILVETAALALCQDLHLTPDIGVGKGIDVVDIRARAAAHETGKMDPTAARLALEHLTAAGVCPSRGLRDRLLKRGVLDVQCKAADRRGGGDGVLYFGYRDMPRGEDELLVPSLAQVIKLPPFERLRRFISVQASVLRGDWLESSPHH